MIFRPELVKLILAGRKTMTRRPVKAGEKECRYQPGKSYALQPGRGRAAVERITILEVRQEPLGAIALKDVLREGFKTTAEFVDYWTQLHGSHDPAQPVWVISFAKGDATDTPRMLRATAPTAPTCKATLTSGPRKGKVCGRAFPDRDYLTDREVTVCKCGARRPPATVEDVGYTSRRAAAMKDEGEAVPERTQQRITQRAADNAANGYIMQRERLLAAVSEIRRHAVDRGALENLRGIERQLAALDRKMKAVA